MISATPSRNNQDQISALTGDFAEAARVLFSAGTVLQTWAQLAELAVDTIEGASFAGIVLLEGDVLTTPACTDPVVIDLDELQHRDGEGPCVDALAHRVTVYAEDLTADARWPRFGPQAAHRGIRSVLSLPIFADANPGALNLYAANVDAFAFLDRARGLFLAGLATPAVASARRLQDEVLRGVNLRDGLDTREIIGQAQGILMERERLTAQEAFMVLRNASQHLNVKIRDVAQTLVETGERPETGLRRTPTPYASTAAIRASA